MAKYFFSKSFYSENRRQFSELLAPRSLALISTYHAMPRSADQFFPHKPNPNILYLTGITQPETMLLVFPDCPNPAYKEILFISDRNESAEVWYGKRLSKEEARSISGIENVNWLSAFNTVLRDAMSYAENVYMDYNEYGSFSGPDYNKHIHFINELRNAYPLHNYKRAYPLIGSLRVQKKDEEIALLKKAIGITGKAIHKVMKVLKPGIAEYEIEAEISYAFTKNAARFHGFQPIVAGGINACCLHYNENNGVCNEGDLLLMDMGAEIEHYTSDITRTLPVNGTFSKRQKLIYNTVLNVQKQAFKMYVPGNTINNINTQTGQLMEEAILGIGLLKSEDVKKQPKDAPLYKKYYPHGVAHFLGMDAHDVGHKFLNLMPGMVLTCEPGIYIIEEKMGIRLENDVLITDKGPVNLSEEIPIEADEIETIMSN